MIFLRKGKYYKYTSGDRSLKALSKFATESYHRDSEDQGEVPKELTTVGYAFKVLQKFYEEVIFGFESVFQVFNLSHLPWYAKVGISLFFIFSPAIFLALAIFWCEKRYLDSKETVHAEPVEESKKPNSNIKKKVD